MPTTNKIHLDFYSDYYNLGGRAHIFAKATKLIKMELKSSEIDFKLILTKYEQQDTAIERASNLLKQQQEKYKNLLIKLEHKKKELNTKSKLLNELHLKRTENIMKLRESSERSNLIAEKCKNIHEKSHELELDIKKASDQFLETINNKDAYLKDLRLKFTDESLIQEIEKYEEKYNLIKDKEIYLKDLYDQLKQQEPDENYYKNLNLSHFVNISKK